MLASYHAKMTIAQTFDGFNGLSPDEGSPLDQSLLDDETLKDDVPFEDVKPGKKSSSSNSRKGPHAADKRANHNAIERARRESLNGRFLVSLGVATVIVGSVFARHFELKWTGH